MFTIPKDAVLCVSFDVRAVTPEGSEHLFTHVTTRMDGDLEALADSLAMLAVDAGATFSEAVGIAPNE